MTKQAKERLSRDMAEDGMILNYLPVNQAYMVTFGSWDGSRVFGPASLSAVAEWWEDLNHREEDSWEDCNDC